MNRQRFITIMLGTSLSTVISSCSIFDSGPSAITKRYFELVVNGEIQKAKELRLSNSWADFKTSEQITESDIDKHLMSISKAVADDGGLKSVETKDENVHGDMAEVKFTIFLKNGKSQSGKMELTKKDSGWKIGGYVFDKGFKASKE